MKTLMWLVFLVLLSILVGIVILNVTKSIVEAGCQFVGQYNLECRI